MPAPSSRSSAAWVVIQIHSECFHTRCAGSPGRSNTHPSHPICHCDHPDRCGRTAHTQKFEAQFIHSSNLPGSYMICASETLKIRIWDITAPAWQEPAHNRREPCASDYDEDETAESGKTKDIGIARLMHRLLNHM